MMTRSQAIRALARRHQQQVVVPTMTALAAWEAARPSELTMPCVGAMGSASSMGLGLALARPERTVWVLDGDGSLLMQLGSLATIAGADSPNLYHFVFENGVYAFSGGQPVPAAGKLDFAALARAAGYRAAFTFAEVEELETGLDEALQARGPVLVDLKVSPEADELPQWAIPTNPGERGRRLRALLGPRP